MNSPAIKGSCLCGAVAYAIQPPFYFFQNCFCQRCRKTTGAAHASNILVKAKQFQWTQGEDLVKRFELPDAKYFCTGFCSVCGATLPWLTRTGKAFIVPAGTLDDDPGSKPERNVFWGSKASWYSAVDQLPTFSEEA